MKSHLKRHRTPFDDRQRLQGMLAATFGDEKAAHYWACFLRLLRGQSASWPWLHLWLRRSPRRMYDLLDVATSELILLHHQHPRWDPLDVWADPDRAQQSLLVRAWAEASRWAYHEAQCDSQTGHPRLLALDWRDKDGAPTSFEVMAAVEQEAPEPEDLALDGPEDHPRLNWDGLTWPQVAALAAYASGISFAELARLDGRSQQAVRSQYRTAVRRLMRANPWLVETYGSPPWMEAR